MRADILNPFLEATVSLIKEMTDLNLKRGKLELQCDSVKILGIAAIVGITGDLSGRVLIDMEIQTALKLASIMNFEEFTEVNNLVRSTIQEVANMISGKAIMLLNNKGYNLDITPPTICEGKNTIITNRNAQLISVPFESEIGRIIIDLGIIESEKSNN